MILITLNSFTSFLMRFLRISTYSEGTQNACFPLHSVIQGNLLHGIVAAVDAMFAQRHDRRNALAKQLALIPRFCRYIQFLEILLVARKLVRVKHDKVALLQQRVQFRLFLGWKGKIGIGVRHGKRGRSQGLGLLLRGE